MATVTTFEYCRLPVAEAGQTDEPHITAEHFEALFAYQDRLPSGAISFQKRGITLSSYCGIVQVGTDVLEILPKIHKQSGSATAHRALLMEMLSLCYDLKIHVGAQADVAMQRQHILYVFVQAFCAELSAQLRGGLIRVYSQQSENLQVIKGRINWTRQLRDNVVHQERMFCDYEELAHNNPYNQVIRCTLRVLRGIARGNAQLTERIHALSLYFDGVDDAFATGRDVRALPRSRLVSRYEAVFQWCEWFLDQLNPEVYSGKRQVFSLLFDMNDLFQRYIYRLTRRAAASPALGGQLVVRAEQPQRHLLRQTDQGDGGRGYFSMRPDITVSSRRTGAMKAIFDTKWKSLDPASRRGYWGISQADVYQMLAYSQGYGCNSMILLYPHHEGLETLELPRFAYELKGAEHQPRLNIDTIRLQAEPGHPMRRGVAEQLEQLLFPYVEH